MKKKGKDGCLEVKGTVIEELGSKTRVIYDGGIHRDIERESWRERQEMRRYNSVWRIRDRRTFMDWDDADVDDVLPRCEYYVETTERVRVRYRVDGQTYEKDVVLSGIDGRRRKRKKIYLTLDLNRAEEPLNVSLYKSESSGYCLLYSGTLLVALVLFVIAWLMYCGQAL